MLKRILFAMFFGATPVLLTAQNPWNGTWKLDEAKTTVAPSMFTLTALPNGGFHLNDYNGEVNYDYTCDGKPYKTFGDHTGTCKKVDDLHYEMAGSEHGKPLWHGTSVISADGKTMTNEWIDPLPSGGTKTTVNNEVRVGSGHGRAGTWKLVSRRTSIPVTMAVSLTGDVFRIDSKRIDAITTAKLDGSVAHREGPGVDPDTQVKMRKDGARAIRYSDTYKGKPSMEGTFTVSLDGKTLIDEYYDPVKPADKGKNVYTKE